MNASDTKEYLTCKAGPSCIAIAICSVLEVFQTRSITRVPGCPRFIIGMTNVRGTAVPVVDLYNAFNRDEHVRSVVILTTSEGPVGLLINTLYDIARLDPSGTPSEDFRAESNENGYDFTKMNPFEIIDADAVIRSTIPHSRIRKETAA